jgi:AcrR family transcriptional regulator
MSQPTYSNAPMKTRDRILATSLMLFNEEGEQNVTTVDIANEMEISPGNLYYHFHGKGSIIDQLYSQYEQEMTSLLEQSLDRLESLEDHWLFIYVIFEEIFKFRFFYLNASDIMLRYPEIERSFRKLIAVKIGTIGQLCHKLTGRVNLDSRNMDIRLLAENIVLNMIYWFPYQKLLHPEMDCSQQIHKGVYHILNLVLPYTGNRQNEFLKTIQILYQESLLKK